MGAAFLLAPLGPALRAQGNHQHGPPRPAIQVPRLSRPPVIDGRFDPFEWQEAVRVGGFTQQEPSEGAPATEATEVYLGRDATTFFVAFVAFDREMPEVRAVHTSRDQVDAAPDRVGLWLDPRRSGSRAYVFQFNPLGVQYDGIWSRRWDTDWDGVAVSNGRVDVDHYVVEVAVPIASLAGGSSAGRWDVNFSRIIGRRGEESWWAPVSRAARTSLTAAFGTLEGMESASAGLSLEVLPTVVAGRLGGGPAGGWDNDAGLTARIPLGASGRLEATVNPDFSFVEGDAPQSSFNERWALYYPEKRPFFQDGADQFGTPGTGYVSSPLRLVHTRTIAQPRHGLRFTLGPPGGFVGAMWTRQDRFGGGDDGGTAVVRGLRQWSGGSRAGVTVTHRDRPGAGWSAVGAADGQWRASPHLTMTAQVAGSRSRDSLGQVRDAVAAYVDVIRDDGRSFQELVFRRIPADFAAEAGFVPRGDLQQVVGHGGWFWRPERPLVQWVNPMLQVVQSWDERGAFADREWLPHLEVQGARETNLWLGYRLREERFRGRDHQGHRIEARIRSRPRPWVGFGAGFRAGRWLRYDTALPTDDRSAVVPYSELHVTVDGRLGTTGSLAGTMLRRSFGGTALLPPRAVWAAQVRLGWQFSNRTSARLLMQHDPDSRRWVGSFLLGHVLDYGTQFHLGVEHGHWGTRSFARAAYRLRVTP
jgi:hypothetical protein